MQHFGDCCHVVEVGVERGRLTLIEYRLERGMIGRKIVAILDGDSPQNFALLPDAEVVHGLWLGLTTWRHLYSSRPKLDTLTIALRGSGVKHFGQQKRRETCL